MLASLLCSGSWESIDTVLVTGNSVLWRTILKHPYVAVQKCLTLSGLYVWCHSCTSHGVDSLVPRPNFLCAACRLVKNRVWTLPLWKMGQVYIWWAVNWIIVGVNYIISYQQQHLLCCQKSCKLFMMTHNAIYSTWAIWLVWQHADTLIWLRPNFTNERVQTLFFNKAAGRTWKFGVWGRDIGVKLAWNCI